MTAATDHDARAAAPGGTIDPPGAHRPRGSASRHIIGAFFVFTGGIHLGLVAADPQIYDGFADGSLFAFVREGWQQIVMAEPAVYGMLLVLGEVTLGVALLVGGRAARLGWIGAIAFHVLLLLFGWGFWAWAVPALAVLVPLALIDLRAPKVARP